MEINTQDETKVIIEYIKNTKTWKIERIGADGCILLDFQESLGKTLKSIQSIQRVVYRHKSVEEYGNGHGPHDFSRVSI